MKKVLTSTAILFLLVVFGVFVESKVHTLARLFDNYILDNYNHYLSCEQLPDREYVELVLSENVDLVNALYAAGANAVGTGDSEMSCEKTADIIIFYNGHDDRVRIEEILGNQTFKGIPIRLKNV